MTPQNLRDWSGWILTVLSVAWNVRQYIELRQARSQAIEARHQLHHQRVLQVLSSTAGAVARLSQSVDFGRRSEVRQQCVEIAGELAHLRTYGGGLFEEHEQTELQEVGRDVHNVLQLTSKAETDSLEREEKTAMRNFCLSAGINIRSYQGRFENTQDLQETK